MRDSRHSAARKREAKLVTPMEMVSLQVRTPQDPQVPLQATAWTAQVDECVRKWGRESEDASNSHFAWSFRFRVMHRTLGCLQIASAACASFLSISAIQASASPTATTVLALSSTGSVVLMSVTIFLNWNVRAAWHNLVANEYQDLHRETVILCDMPPSAHDDVQHTLRSLAMKMNLINAKSPLLPRWFVRQRPEL